MFRSHKDGVTFSVKVIPKASNSAIVGWEGEHLKVRLAAVPEKGEANRELISYLADWADVAKSAVLLLRGDTSRIKSLLIRGRTPAELQERLSKIH